MENATAIIIDAGFTTIESDIKLPPSITNPIPNIVPTMPPMADKVADSIKN